VLGAAWSPDARVIAVMADTGLHVLDARTGGLQWRAPVTSYFYSDPVWSPDGRRIAFGRYVYDGNRPLGRGFATFLDVYVVNSDGGGLHRLTGIRGPDDPDPLASLPLSPNPVGGSAEPESWAPTWWPDGSRLFFHRHWSNSSWSGQTIFIMNADGTCETPFGVAGLPVAANSVSPFGPAWRPGAGPSPPPLTCVDLALAPGPGEARLGNLQYPHVIVNQLVPYTMAVKNDGTLPTSRLRLDIVPSAYVRVVRAPNGCTRRRSAVSCRLPGEVAASGATSISFTIEAIGPGGAHGLVKVRIRGTGPDIDTANNAVVMDMWIRPTSVAAALPVAALHGTDADETLFGRPRGDLIPAGAGHDRVFAGAGSDTVLVRDGQRDVVRCGSGSDTVIGDRGDVVSRDCERVRRRG
jgi:hypothetical protein